MKNDNETVGASIKPELFAKHSGLELLQMMVAGELYQSHNFLTHWGFPNG